MGNLTSSFTISFLSGTDSLYIEESVVQFEGDSSSAESAGSLLQVYNTDTEKVTPDWTVTTNQPCLKLALTKSSDGENINLTGATFQYQGNDIEFDETSTVTNSDGSLLNGMSWYLSTGTYAGMFMKAFSDDNTNYAYFRICANIASSDITTNQQIGYTLKYSDSTFGSDSMGSTTDILIREGSSSSIYCNILTDNTELSTSVTETVLSVQYIYGDTEYDNLESLAAMVDNVASIAWYKDGVALGITSETLTVYRDQDQTGTYNNYVDGCNVFSVMVLDASGGVLASDSQRITDIADQYQVKLTKTGTVRSNKDATVEGILYDGDEPYSGSVTYTTSVYNANNEQTGTAESTTSTEGFSRTITADECKYTNTDEEEEYGECYLVVQCSF